MCASSETGGRLARNAFGCGGALYSVANGPPRRECRRSDSDDLQGCLGASSAIVGGLSAKARVTRAASSTFLEVAQRDRPMMSLTACSCWLREPTAAMVMRDGRWIKTVDQPSIGWRGQQGR